MPLEEDDLPGAEYYVNCFGRLSKGDKFKWILVEDFSHNDIFDDDGEFKGRQFSIVGVDKTLEQQRMHVEDWKLTFPLLKPQFLFDGKKAMFYSRIPVRNRLKGMSVQNGTLEDPLECLSPMVATIYKKLRMKELYGDEDGPYAPMKKPKKVRLADFDEPAAPVKYNPYKGGRVETYLIALNYPIAKVPLRYGMKMLTEKDVLSVPVAQEWCLTPSFTPTFDFCLFRRTVPVALLGKDNKYVMINSIYKQELLDQFPKLVAK